MKFLTTKKRIIIAGATAALVVGTGGAAFAWFTANGKGSGNATVGTTKGTNAWSVTSDTGSGIYPDDTFHAVSFTVKNTTSGTLELQPSFVSASINADSSSPANVMQATSAQGTFISAPGCQAGWFSLGDQGTLAVAADASGSSADGDTGVKVPANKTATVTVQLKMTDADANQDACQGINGPEITLDITSPTTPQ